MRVKRTVYLLRLLPFISYWMQFQVGSTVCLLWLAPGCAELDKVQTFFGSEPFKITLLSTIIPQADDARFERREIFIAVSLLWKSVCLNWGRPRTGSPVGQNGNPEALSSNTYVGNNVLCPTVRTWYLTNCPASQQREDSAFSLDNMFRCLNFMILNAIIKFTQKTVVAFCQRESLYTLILHFCTKSTLLLYNPYLYSPEGL